MTLLAPLALLGLLALPAIWWLIRATPPPPRDVAFPALLLLRRLARRQEDTARAPLWLLILRLCAAGLVIFGLAQPTLLPHATTPSTGGSGPLVIVVDDGWASIATWRARIAAAQSLAAAAAREGRTIALLRSARGPDGALPEPVVARDGAQIARTLAQWRPEPWGPDRAALAQSLDALRQHLTGTARIVVLSDGIASADDAPLRTALSTLGTVSDMRWDVCDTATIGARTGATLNAEIHTPGGCPARAVTVRARGETGATLGVFPATIAAGAQTTTVALNLPALLRNRTASLTLDGANGPAGVRLLDAGDRRHPVGLIASRGSDTPLVGALFFLNRALAPIADVHEGDAAQLVASPLSVLVATDGTLANPHVRDVVARWVQNGGELIRFAGPEIAQPQTQEPGAETATPAPDLAQSLLPVPLMGMRQIGGAMSWGHPQHLNPFPDDSPFTALPIPGEVTVSRQVLAQPGADLDRHVWARLADGTPLVTASPLGHGEIVLFHVTPGADWSNLPLSGLFPDMLQRLIDRSAGQRDGVATGDLAPALTLDSDGLLGPAPQSARSIAADAFRTTSVSALHPAGLYGPQSGRRALNLGDAPGAGGASGAIDREPLLGTAISPAGAAPERPFGPWLALLGVLLLLADLLASLRLRGLLGRLAAAALVIGLSGQAHAQYADPPPAPPPAPAPAPAPLPANVPRAAVETHLGYVLSGDSAVDDISREGLRGLSNYVNARTSAQLGAPDGVTPGHDNLSYYPMLYWPITPNSTTNPHKIDALNAYMAHGGIILIDTQGAGSELDDAGQSAATQAALRRVTDGLDIPALAKLTSKHVLAHTFYLLRDFPGRLAGQPVWVAQSGDESNDDVSPVIIGSADWAHAWAVDSSGGTPYAVIPGGDDQRTLAYRFGVNVVLYALTGNYKADQVHIPAILKRLGGE
jgi:hypothetical protein